MRRVDRLRANGQREQRRAPTFPARELVVERLNARAEARKRLLAISAVVAEMLCKLLLPHLSSHRETSFARVVLHELLHGGKVALVDDAELKPARSELPGDAGRLRFDVDSDHNPLFVARRESELNRMPIRPLNILRHRC